MSEELKSKSVSVYYLLHVYAKDGRPDEKSISIYSFLHTLTGSK
jgi:hypothetical protein